MPNIPNNELITHRPKSMCLNLQNHPIFKITVAIVVTVLYFHWMTQIHEKHDNLIKQSGEDTVELLRSFETKTLSSFESLKNKVASLSQPTQPTQTEGNKIDFGVADTGFWEGMYAKSRHVFDEPLATALITFLKAENVKTLLELGCGTGAYAKQMKAAGILVACYDGNPQTQDLSEGRCGVVDLSKPLDFVNSNGHFHSKLGNIFQKNLRIFL
ncbi:uncharacterized protein LOC118433948 [Folsomia candida]|uniref:uncharacterized protein LOC118433948 n=1 Tax=Folsomia candida TaxID=158441 RepID=UPI00160535D5|nr:uncharacterized protein LOC118433948 [Folsomia candida]